MEDLKRLERDVSQQAQQVASMPELHALRADVLGKKGPLSALLRQLGKLPAAERPLAGQKINEAKVQIELALGQAAERLQAQARQEAQKAGYADLSLPGRYRPQGALHPLRLVEQDIVTSLARMGFVVAEGPLVEDDWHNFGALNIPEDHPARDMQDTFFLTPQTLLRTHTSNVQIRTMLQQEPPVRIVAPGMVFRHDDVDATHSPVFHQIEGLWIDEKATFADLKGCLRRLIADLFGPQAKLRFRPSFFPFTEPSAEVDMSCAACHGQSHAGCRICKGTGWLEILGCGMVDPNVLQAVGYDPERVQGFAFGMGIERIALLRYGIDDIRLFFENDKRFLKQFSGSALSVSL